jgi:8-hydroxy-5-deazaflavin:NADPH oxidoreductase
LTGRQFKPIARIVSVNNTDALSVPPLVRIAIIGCGNVGRAIANSAVRAGHQVVMAATTPESAAEAAAATGATAAKSNAQAVHDAELVFLAVPPAKVEAIAVELGPQLDGRVVVELGNRINRLDPGAVLDGTSLAERVQQHMPKARVVKALNTVFAEKIANPAVDGMRLDGYVAGDDEQAKAQVLEFVGSIGLRPIDAGPLAMARALEAMALLIVTLQIRNGWPRLNGWKLIGPPAES